MIKQLRQLSPIDKLTIEEKLRDHLFQSTIWQEAKVIGITYATDIEWNTHLIIEAAWKRNKQVVLPKSNRKTKQMEFYRIDSFDMLEEGYKGILEPIESKTIYYPKSEIDLIIVPGIVFDEAGFRIGFGGGFYDRYLADFSNRTLSLLSEIQLVNRLVREEHDIAVQYKVTENGFI